MSSIHHNPVSSIHHNPVISSAPSSGQFIHNKVSPNNPLSKLHELNKNITPTSFKTSSPQSSSFASIVHSKHPVTLSNATVSPFATPPGYQTIAPKKPPFDANSMNAMNAMANRELTGGKVRQLGVASPLQNNQDALRTNIINDGGEQVQNDYALLGLDWKDGVADLPGEIKHIYK